MKMVNVCNFKDEKSGEKYKVFNFESMDTNIMELCILDSIKRTKTIKEAVDYMEEEYGFLVTCNYREREVKEGRIKLKIFEETDEEIDLDDLKKVVNTDIKKEDVIGYLEFLKENSEYDEFNIFADDTRVVAYSKK